MGRRSIANTPLPGGGGLADTVIWRDRIFYMDPEGRLYVWGKRRWCPMIVDARFGAQPQPLPPREERRRPQQRRKGYAAHPGFAGKAR